VATECESFALGLLRFRPILVEKIWGGRRLEAAFGRALPEGRSIGESWEVSGLMEALTPVAEGPFKGADVYRLAEARGEEVFGPGLAGPCREDFPLLVKFIDASAVLSVQVHPGDEYARGEGFPNGKSETWVVAAADEGACVFRGFNDGVGPEEFREALDSGEVARVERCLRRVEVKAGDVIDLPARTVHAIGAGCLLCEIQQSSDLTYRVYDWGRAGLDGKPRPLHLDKAWDVMDFAGDDAGPDIAHPVAGDDARAGGGAELAVYRDSYPFHLETAKVSGRARVESPGDRFEIVSVLSGRGEVAGPDGRRTRLAAGDSAMVPASWDGYEVICEEPMKWVRAWVV